MPIIGVDQGKCNVCLKCIRVCGSGLFKKKEDGKIDFKNNGFCNLCGHCIGICSEDAILRELSWEDDVETFPGVKNPELITSYETVMQMIKANRSIRRYKQKEVPPELIQKVFEAMRYAPSASNARLWKYKIIYDPKTRDELGYAIVRAMYTYMGFKSPESAVEMVQKSGRGPVFYDAPAVIILYVEGKVPGKTMFGLWGNDAGIAITYGQMAAQALGLGTCWIGAIQGAIPRNKEEIYKILDINGIVFGAMTIGYPAIKYSRTVPRAPLDVKELKI